VAREDRKDPGRGRGTRPRCAGPAA
jgi:hypothetical protein